MEGEGQGGELVCADASMSAQMHGHVRADALVLVRTHGRIRADALVFAQTHHLSTQTHFFTINMDSKNPSVRKKAFAG